MRLSLVLFLSLSVILLSSCASSGGFSVGFSRVRFEGQAWRLELPEPSPTRKVGGVAGWKLQRAEGDRVAWFYGDAFAGWPPSKVLLLLALEDRPSQGSPGGAEVEDASMSWLAAWEKPGFVGHIALDRVADELRWIGEARRRRVVRTDSVGSETPAPPKAEEKKHVRPTGKEPRRGGDVQPGEQDVAPFIAHFSETWGGALSGGFWVRGHVLCRRLEHVPVISCVILGLPTSEAPREIGRASCRERVFVCV